MKRIIQSTALMIALLLMSAPAWSLSYVDHVSQAPNGKGDVLVYPIYWSFGAFETKIQVINTSPNVSAIAKVVVRSPWLSEELLDFFIFLTPTDVWEGYLKMVDGKATLYSEDDSILVDLAPTFASPENPVSQPLIPQCDTDIFGYAEVFLTYVFPESYRDINNNLVNLTNPPVDKEVLYENFVGSRDLRNPDPLTGGTPDSYDKEWNILAGNQQIQNPAINWTSALNATTLKDYRISGLENVQQETVFGTRANNNILEVEAALSKNNIGMPYINNEEGATFHWFNFPTKLTLTDDDCRINGWRGAYAGFVGLNPFLGGTRWEFVATSYTPRIYDMKENEQKGESPIFSPAPKVTNQFILETDVVVPSAFSKGWVRYDLDNGPTLGGENLNLDLLEYTGAPVIPVALNIGAGGLSTMYGFYDDGLVTGDTGPLYGFQYVRTLAFSPGPS